MAICNIHEVTEQVKVAITQQGPTCGKIQHVIAFHKLAEKSVCKKSCISIVATGLTLNFFTLV